MNNLERRRNKQINKLVSMYNLDKTEVAAQFLIHRWVDVCAEIENGAKRLAEVTDEYRELIIGLECEQQKREAIDRLDSLSVINTKLLEELSTEFMHQSFPVDIDNRAASKDPSAYILEDATA